MEYATEGDYYNLPFNMPFSSAEMKEIYTRMGVSPDGSCFFHSLLAIVYSEYHATEDKKKRKSIVKHFRKQIAEELTMEQFKELRIDDGFVSTDNSYSKYVVSTDNKEMDMYNAFQKYLANRKQYVGAEVYHYMSDYCNLDIYIIKMDSKGNGELVPTLIPFEMVYKGRHSGIILYVGSHYEPIGVMLSKNEIQYIFEPDYPLIKEFYNAQKKTWDNYKAVMKGE